MEDDVDPWDWNVDRVVDELCYSRTLWAQGRPNSVLPDQNTFAELLREHDVNGSTLLTNVNDKLLKEDFRITSIGKRSSVTWAVDQLRRRSRRYREERPAFTLLSSAASTPMHFNSFVFHGQHTPQQAAFADQPTIIETPLHPSAYSSFGNQIRSPPDGASPDFMRPAPPQQLTHFQPEPQTPQPPPTMRVDSPLDTRSGQRRAGEQLVEDQHGRKKRRLNLSASAPARQDTGTGTLVPKAEAVVTVTSGATRSKPRKSDIRSQLCGLAGKAPSYLGKNKFHADDIFFSSTKFGTPLNADIELSPIMAQDSSPEDVFLFDGSTAPQVAGRQSLVNRKLMSFFTQPSELEVDFAPDSLTFYPYHASSSSIPEARALIHIKHKDDIAVATREQLLRLRIGNINPESDPASSNHDFDYLAHWHDERSKELPALGESDEETDDEELDALEKEMEEGAKEAQNNGNKLTFAQVDEVTDEAIKNHIRKWEATRLPVLQHKGLSIWRKGRTARGRIAHVQRAQGELTHFERRLSKYKDDITKDIWPTKKRLLEQFQSLEQTIEQIEETKFELSVWKRAAAPPAPKGKLITRKKRSTHTTDVDDEHVVDDDEEIVDDHHGLDDFLDVDDLVPVDQSLSTGLQEAHNEQGSRERSVEDMDIDNDNASDLPELQDIIIKTPKSRLEKTSNEAANSSNCQMIKEEPSPSARSKHSTSFNAGIEVIDLTLDSDDAIESPLADKQLRAVSPIPPRGRSHQAVDPTNASNCQVADWDWNSLEQDGKRVQIIVKLIREMPVKEYQRLREYILGDDETRQLVRLHEIAEHVKSILRHCLNKHASLSIAKHAYDRADELLHLYVCWLELQPQHFREGYDVWEEVFKLVTLDEQCLKDALKTINEDNAVDLGDCLGLIYGVFEKHPCPLDGDEDRRKTEEAGDKGITEPDPSTPNKRRKRAIAESQSALSMRRNVQKNVNVWNDRTKNYLSQNARQSSDLAPASANIVVNTGKDESQAEILIDQNISESLKKHQIEGIRFMWREIVGAADRSSDDDAAMQGCLLAHTMGLGKTCQVISFLTTLMQAARSEDKAIKEQIPRKLRRMRTLILCPASLIDNWEEEFGKWTTRETTGTVWILRAQLPKRGRLSLLDEWFRDRRGGTLLLGYELFRSLIHNKSANLDEEEHEQVRKQLLNGPTLIIADEAHKLKNHSSAITRAANMLRSRSRIALTGSPLSNNLVEYFSMVDWIAPGYLGRLEEFKANYVEPIEEGLYVGSSNWERRKARIKLGALTRILDPKIDRKEIEVLKNDLKSKTEFVLHIPLTPLQMTVYKTFVAVANNSSSMQSMTRYWGELAMLQLLCSHPTLFVKGVEKAKEKAKEKGNKARPRSPVKRIQELQTGASSRNSNAAEPDQVSIETDQSEETKDDTEDEDGVPLDAGAVQVAIKVLTELDALFQPMMQASLDEQLSHKVNLLLQIVQNAKAAKDKLLIFSHRILTLDYLGMVLEKAGIVFQRLDGSTKIAKRQGMTKAFNEDGNCDAFLVSTRAGGTGFNLHGANRVILFDFSFNPTWEQQAIGRAFRLGQQKPVYVYRFISGGTFEQKLFNQIIFKTQLAYQAVDKKNTKNKAHKMRTFIEEPEPTTLKDLSECNGKDAVLETVINSMEKGSELIHELGMAEQLKELNQEQLDEAAQGEMQQLIDEEKLRNTDYVAYQKMQAAKHAVPAASARQDPVDNILQASAFRPAPPATAPVAAPVTDLHGHRSPTDIPFGARFPPPNTAQIEPHGLPLPPSNLRFDLFGVPPREPRPYSFAQSSTQRQDGQQGGS